MTIWDVNDRQKAKEFISLPRALYKNDPNWICPLDKEIEAIFDPRRNNFFSHGACNRWIVKDNAYNVIGRIAAFINHEKAFKNPQPTGGIGFFECVNDKAVAHLLFSTAQNWLHQKGMQAMDGPINFGENDKYWGLLVEGFEPPGYGMNYNPYYYLNLFESYGFQGLYDQFTNFLDTNAPLPERFVKIAEWIMKKPGYSFRHFKKDRFDELARDFMEVYNDAWSVFENFTPINMETIRESFRQMKPVLDEKIIWYAYHHDEPVAFILCLPDVNQILKHLNGKLNLVGKLKFLWYKKTTTIDRLRVIIMGCKKKYQNHGIESGLIRCLQNEVIPRNTIKGVELAWVGDFNAKMMALHNAVGARKEKIHRTYRYIFR